MNVSIFPSPLAGKVQAVPSKSYAHRLLLAAALAESETFLCLDALSDDIEASIACLAGLGAKVVRTAKGLWVFPRAKEQSRTFFCSESGSTYRFFLPVACAFGGKGEFLLENSLANRPMKAFFSVLRENGAVLTPQKNSLIIDGKLSAGEYRLPGNISSQYISGLIFALPLLEGDSCICLTAPPVSQGYIAMTLSAVGQFGIKANWCGEKLFILGKQTYCSPKTAVVPGDWSNGAVFLAAGAFSKAGVRVEGLSFPSKQGDCRIVSLLQQFGAEVKAEDGAVTVKKGDLRGICFDGEDIPDLIPILSVVAAFAKGETRITGVDRLRYKESDRLAGIAATLSALGGRAKIADNTLVIGGGALKGGTAEGFNDHRMVMMAALAACQCSEKVVIQGAQAVNKSYPGFFEALNQVMERKDGIQWN